MRGRGDGAPAQGEGGPGTGFAAAEARPPVEEYREGPEIWKYSGMAQSFQFDLCDCTTGHVTRFDDLLGLVPYTACAESSEIHRLGELAQAEKIWIYVALRHGGGAGADGGWLDKLKLLNRYFGERLATPNKKILILPDYFGLYREFSHGQIMADFGLTAMEG